MVTAVIILAVIAVLLGGYILLDMLYLNKRKTAVATAVEVEIPEEEQPTVIDAKPIVKEVQTVEFHPEELRESVTAQEVDTLMDDEVAESLIEKSEVKADRTKQGIINIDTLSQNFKSGEKVTLDEIKKRIKGFSKTTYIKVLARGTLDKALTVEADSFSLQAVKMIVLTGGKAIKKSE